MDKRLQDVIDSIVNSHIESEWANNRRIINVPAAREEMLSAGSALFSKPHSTIPANIFTDEQLTMANVNPVIFDMSGKLGGVYLNPDDAYQITLRNHAGNILSITNV